MDESYVLKYPELEHAHFWWKVRRELISRILSERVGLIGTRILDVGCGAGLTMRRLADAGALVEGIEVDPAFERASVVEPGVIRYGDILMLDIERRYDVVLMLDVLEHIEDEGAALARVIEILEPGGLFVLTVPAYQWLWSHHDEMNKHHRRYTARSVSRVLGQAGLQVERCGYLFAGLVPPKLVLRIWERLTSRPPEHGGFSTDGVLAWLSEKWFSTELGFALRSRSFLPFGTSVVAVARKPGRTY